MRSELYPAINISDNVRVSKQEGDLHIIVKNKMRVTEERLEKYTTFQLSPKEGECIKSFHILFLNLFFKLLHLYFPVES